MELPDELTARQKKAIRDWAAIGVKHGTEEFDTLWLNTFPTNGRADTVSHRVAEKRAAAVREAEAVLFSLHYASSIELHKCKSCGREFATNYRYNRHCSDECLAQSLQDKMGIKWDPAKTAEERWRGEPPTIISPDTLQVLKTWATNILGYVNVTPAKDDQTINTVNDSFIVYREAIAMDKQERDVFADEMREVLKSLDPTEWPSPPVKEEDDMDRWFRENGL